MGERHFISRGYGQFHNQFLVLQSIAEQKIFYFPSPHVGPAKFNIKRKDGTYLHIRHAFDGMPYMHRFVFSALKNQVTYNSRNLSQEVERKLSEDPSFNTLFFGHTDPAINIFVKLYRAYKRLRAMNMDMDGRKPSDAMIGVTPTPNFPLGKEHFTDVYKVGDQVLVSKTDANMLQLLDAESLGKPIKHVFFFGLL